MSRVSGRPLRPGAPGERRTPEPGCAGETFGVLALAVGAFLLFLPSLWGDFLLDDLFYIVHHPVTRDPSRWLEFLYAPAAFAQSVGTPAYLWRPVLGLSHALNYGVAGLAPFWFHVHDSLLHSANTVLVFWLLRRLTGRGPHAWVGAALFCVHPAQAQSVAYTSARPSLLSLFFCLVSFLLYLRRWDAEGRDAAWRVEAAGVGAFALALLAKESSLFLPPAYGAYETAVRREDRRLGGRLLRRLAPHAVVALAYLVMRTAVLGIVSQRGPWGESWASHFQLAAHGLFKTVSLVVWPVALREPYGFLLGPGFFSESVAMALALAGLAGLAAWGVWKRSLAGLGLFWFVAALLPVSNLVPLGALAADRHLYAPLAGAALAVAAALKGRCGKPALAACMALAAALTFQCLDAQLMWRNGFTLATEACARAPGEPYAALRLSTYYLEWRMLARAEELAVGGLAPRAPLDVQRLACKRLALIRMEQRRFSEARGFLERSLAINPRQKSVLEMLARCSLALGERAAAQAYSLRAAALP